MPNNDSDPSSEESPDDQKREDRVRIQEGTRRRGGVNDAPKPTNKNDPFVRGSVGRPTFRTPNFQFRT